MHRRIRAAVPFLLLPAIVLLGYAQLLRSPGSLLVDSRRATIDYASKNPERSPGNDLTSVFLPRFILIADQFKILGRLPVWDVSGFGGRPLVGNPQAGLFYPPAWIALVSANPAALGWLTIGHLIGAGLGIYALGRTVGLSKPGSVVAGVVFELTPYLLGHVFEGHYPHVWSACWYPWAFWSMLHASRGRRFGIFLCPLILALAFLCGHPQEWYYLILALGFWWLFQVVHDSRGAGSWRTVRGLFLWGVIHFMSLSFVAVELFPQREAMEWTLRSGVIPLRFINRYQIRPENLLQLLSPIALGSPHDYFGHDNYWETLLSIGLTPLVLATVGFFRFPDRRIARAWGGLVLLALIFAAGRRLGLFSLAYLLLPGMDRFRVPSRSLFLAALGASILAGMGMDVLLNGILSNDEGKRIRRMAIAGLLSAGLFVFGVSRIPLPTLPDGQTADIRGVVLVSGQGPSKDMTPGSFRLIQGTRGIAADPVFLGVLPSLIVVFIFLGARGSRHIVMAYSLAAIGMIELVLSTQGMVVLTSPKDLTRPVLGSVRTAPDTEPFRVAAVESCYSDLAASLARTEKTNINDGFQLQQAADLYERLYPFLEPSESSNVLERPMDEPARIHRTKLARKILDLMSVNVLITNRAIPWNDLSQTDADQTESRSFQVWRNPSALPKAYMVPRALIRAADEKHTLAWLATIDPRSTVVLDQEIPGTIGGQPFTPAIWLRNEGDMIELHVETSAPGYLVIANTWMPGWSATVNGQPEQVFQGNHCQQVVAIRSKGSQQVTLCYRPPGLSLGLFVSLVSLLGWFAGCLFQTHPCRLRNHHSIVRSVAKSMRNGQLSQSLFSVWLNDSVKTFPFKDCRYLGSCSGVMDSPPVVSAICLSRARSAAGFSSSRSSW